MLIEVDKSDFDCFKSEHGYDKNLYFECFIQEKRFASVQAQIVSHEHSAHIHLWVFGWNKSIKETIIKDFSRLMEHLRQNDVHRLVVTYPLGTGCAETWFKFIEYFGFDSPFLACVRSI